MQVPRRLQLLCPACRTWRNTCSSSQSHDWVGEGGCAEFLASDILRVPWGRPDIRPWRFWFYWCYEKQINLRQTMFHEACRFRPSSEQKIEQVGTTHVLIQLQELFGFPSSWERIGAAWWRAFELCRSLATSGIPWGSSRYLAAHTSGFCCPDVAAAWPNRRSRGSDLGSGN